MPEYQHQNIQVFSVKRRILKKLPALVILTVIFCAMIHGTGTRTFSQGFWYTFILWTVVKLYVTVILHCGWYAHTPSVWIKGTEDLKAEYQDYKFYLSSIPRSLAAEAIVAAVVGFVIMM